MILLALLAPTAPAKDAPKPEPKPDPLRPVRDDPALPRVLLIGDSISMGYTIPVREKLAGKANVHRPNTNCGPTSRGLEQLDAWLAAGGGRWDVIHFNFGLHDLKHHDGKGNLVEAGKGPVQTPTDVYEKNLRQIVARLKKTGAALVWATTTPVPGGARGRVKGDEVKYNDVAARVMRENGVAVDDLYSFAVPILDEIQIPKDVHFTDAGSTRLAGQVAANIEKALAGREGE